MEQNEGSHGHQACKHVWHSNTHHTSSHVCNTTRGSKRTRIKKNQQHIHANGVHPGLKPLDKEQTFHTNTRHNKVQNTVCKTPQSNLLTRNIATITRTSTVQHICTQKANDVTLARVQARPKHSRWKQDHKTAHTITCTDKIKRTLTKERGYISSTPRQHCRARKRPENTAPQNTKHEDACGRTQSQERPCITKAKQQPTQIQSTTHLHTQTQRQTLYIRAAKSHVATSAKHHTQNTQSNVQTRKLRQASHQKAFLFLCQSLSCSRSWIWLPHKTLTTKVIRETNLKWV